jgi:hypothetical protein
MIPPPSVDAENLPTSARVLDYESDHELKHHTNKPKVKTLKPWEFKILVESQKKEMHVRKNQFDNTAAIVYGMNVSLIHFALFVMIAFIAKWPDSEKAAQFELDHIEIDFIKHIGEKSTLIDKRFEEITCFDTSEEIRIWLIKFVVIHLMCCVINLQREIFDTKLGVIPNFLKLFECVLIGTYNFGIIQGISKITIFSYWKGMSEKFPGESAEIRQCFITEDMLG